MQRDNFKINIFKVRNRRKVSSKVFYKSKKRVTVDRCHRQVKFWRQFETISNTIQKIRPISREKSIPFRRLGATIEGNMYLFRDKHQCRAPIMRILLEEKYRNVFSRIIQKPCHDRTHPRRYTDERTNRKFSITRVCSRNGAHSRQFQDKY